MNLYIVRHGQTDWNLEGRIQGLSDVELNKTGIYQAKALRDKLSNVNFDLCISSPLKRAAKTAEIVADNRCKIIYDGLLVERSYGKKEGAISEKAPYSTDRKLGKKDDDPDFEPLDSMLDRAEKFLKKIQNLNAENLLVVSHGTFLKAIYYTILGYDENTDFLAWNLQNCGYEKLELPTKSS